MVVCFKLVPSSSASSRPILQPPPIQTPNADLKCRLHIQTSIIDFKCRLQMRTSNADFKYRLQIQTSNTDFNYRLRIQTSNTDFKYRLQIQTSNADLKCRLQIQTSNTGHPPASACLILIDLERPPICPPLDSNRSGASFHVRPH